jgi:hypothetical protein
MGAEVERLGSSTASLGGARNGSGGEAPHMHAVGS